MFSMACCHESDLEIREHYTDTAGFTDHVFALMHLLGFAFCPRIRDLRQETVYQRESRQYPAPVTDINDQPESERDHSLA
jgi:TnpA family transposase